ncbi:MAG: HIT family protein [Candidatus Thorarchaeota archaeon]|nr:HIT family protein [Candidatus Thorarchaeota archaeon]
MTHTDDCIFCKIVKRQIPASVVFEDEHCMAFMDIYPVSRGHCLLIPKKHFVNLLDVDLDVVAHMARRLCELTRRVKAVLSPDGVLSAVANGEGAGQEVPHLHFHVIPRSKGDPFGFRFPPNYREKMADRSELDKLAKAIRGV